MPPLSISYSQLNSVFCRSAVQYSSDLLLVFVGGVFDEFMTQPQHFGGEGQKRFQQEGISKPTGTHQSDDSPDNYGL